MNYKKIYDQIIERAKRRTIEGYKESHHIVPKCMGGSDDSLNRVDLTAREHFICHYLLYKLHLKSNGIRFAFVAMGMNNPHQQRLPITSRAYALLKKINSGSASERNRAKTYRKGFVTAKNELTGEVSRFVSTENIPVGWIRGNSGKGKPKLALKGRSYFYDPVTSETRSFRKGNDVPSGWIKGNPKADTSARSRILGTSYYYDPLSGTEGRYKVRPGGWVAGRAVKWITNGFENKQINIIIDQVPNGWRLGRTSSNTGKKYAKRKDKGSRKGRNLSESDR